jgi:hypothetical protein
MTWRKNSIFWGTSLERNYRSWERASLSHNSRSLSSDSNQARLEHESILLKVRTQVQSNFGSGLAGWRTRSADTEISANYCRIIYTLLTAPEKEEKCLSLLNNSTAGHETREEWTCRTHERDRRPAGLPAWRVAATNLVLNVASSGRGEIVSCSTRV